MYLCTRNYDLKRGGTFETAKAGTFHSVTAGTSIPLSAAEEFNVNKNLKALHIRFIPEGEQILNISSREFIKKAEFVNVDTLKGGKKDEEPSSGGTTNGGGGSTGGGGNTGGGSGSADNPSEGD